MFSYLLRVRDRTVGVFRDIKNYFYIGSVVKRNIHTVEWNKFKLRVDWINRIYTVINLRPEDFGEADPSIRELRFREKAEPMYEYLMQLNLHEVIVPIIEYIPDSYSYLVKFNPNFQWLTFGWIFSSIIKCLLLLGIYYIIGLIFDLRFFWNVFFDFLKANKILR